MSINEMETTEPVAARLNRKSHRTARKKARDPRDRKREGVTACRGSRRIRERDGTTSNDDNDDEEDHEGDVDDDDPEVSRSDPDRAG